MFERFTDRARRVVVLAQEEARMLHHDHIGTEHILLGLIREGEGAAAKALESLGISLEAVRQHVGEITGQGQQEPSGHIPFTARAKKVLELSLREALQLGHNYMCLVGLTRAADQRLGRPAQRSSLPVVGVSPICLMSGCLCGAREVASRQGQSRRRLVPRRAWAERMRVTGGGYRQVPLPDMRNAIAAACFVKLTGSAPAGSHLQGLRSPGGDVGVVEGDLLTCCEPQPRVGRQASAATSTSGALPARNPAGEGQPR